MRSLGKLILSKILLVFLLLKFATQQCPLFGAEFLHAPSYSLDKALKLPTSQELASELLWDIWKSKSQELRGKTGLVLSGGGARGFAHAGVLRHLEEIAFPIEGMVGTSMGAVIGGLYAAGVSIDHIEKMASDVGFHKFGKIRKIRFIGMALRDSLASTTFANWIEGALGNKTFQDLRLPFIATATDLSSGEFVVLRDGKLASALLASATIPGLFAPVQIRQHFLVDGGVILNVPTEVASLLELENILVANASLQGSDKPLTRTPSAIRAIYRTLEIQGDYLSSSNNNHKKEDFVLKTAIPEIHTFELWRWKEAEEVGLREARSNTYKMRLAFIAKTVTKLGRQFFANP